MANNNKVLTVSYGAFSCTLEGFDDSVGTLKEITEYFRALSASDPGFGEEPMLPDTANLARIAQSAEPRAVDIRTSDRGEILLRAEDAEFVTDPVDEPESAPREDENPFGGLDDPQSADDETIDSGDEDRRAAEFMAQMPPAPQTAHAKSDSGAADPAPDSVAAKLQRIRAVVSRNDAESGGDEQEEDVDAVEELFASAFAENDPQTLDDTDEHSPPVSGPQPDDDAPLDAAAEQDATTGLDTGETSSDTDQNTGAGEPDTGAESASYENVPVSENNDVAAEDEAPDDTIAAASEEPALEQVLSKVQSADDYSTLEQTPAEDADEDFSVPYILKPEEMISDGTFDTGDSENPAEFQPARSTRPDRTLPRGDTDLERLMASADERLGEPESSTTRETYSQLRAAAATTGYEQPASGSQPPQDSNAAYRDDLASVVKPLQPVSGRPGRPSSQSRNAPLKLVPDQRIDIEGSAARQGPVRPRRVYAATTEAAPGPHDPQTTFADFAVEKGAKDLPEVLEAAAAYLSFVEGRKQFSRPQLMSKLRQIEGGTYDREDSLRSFGNLLRDGKIENAGSGRFTASDDIGFRPGKQAGT